MHLLHVLHATPVEWTKGPTMDSVMREAGKEHGPLVAGQRLLEREIEVYFYVCKIFDLHIVVIRVKHLKSNVYSVNEYLKDTRQLADLVACSSKNENYWLSAWIVLILKGKSIQYRDFAQAQCVCKTRGTTSSPSSPSHWFPAPRPTLPPTFSATFFSTDE